MSEPEYEDCWSCSGSGEGPADGTTCQICRGSGELIENEEEGELE